MAEAPVEDPPQLVTDAFLGGRLLLRQPADGHRSGTDAVLLAAAAPGDFSGLAIDAGAGVGAAGLALAIARPNARLGLLENDRFLAGLARANLLQNGLLDRGYVVEADLLSPASRRAAGLTDESAGLVISNPPFLDPGRVAAFAGPPQAARACDVRCWPGGACSLDRGGGGVGRARRIDDPDPSSRRLAGDP